MVGEHPQTHKPLTWMLTVIHGYRGPSGNTCALPDPSLSVLHQQGVTSQTSGCGGWGQAPAVVGTRAQLQVKDQCHSDGVSACISLGPLGLHGHLCRSQLAQEQGRSGAVHSRPPRAPAPRPPPSFVVAAT